MPWYLCSEWWSGLPKAPQLPSSSLQTGSPHAKPLLFPLFLTAGLSNLLSLRCFQLLGRPASTLTSKKRTAALPGLPQRTSTHIPALMMSQGLWSGPSSIAHQWSNSSRAGFEACIQHSDEHRTLPKPQTPNQRAIGLQEVPVMVHFHKSVGDDPANPTGCYEDWNDDACEDPLCTVKCCGRAGAGCAVYARTQALALDKCGLCDGGQIISLKFSSLMGIIYQPHQNMSLKWEYTHKASHSAWHTGGTQ